MGWSLDPELHTVVDGLNEILFGTEIAFGGLNRGMAEQELDLFQVAAGFATEFGAGAAQVIHRTSHTKRPIEGPLHRPRLGIT